MSAFLETLESRRLLSASALVTTLHADESAARTDLATLRKDAAAIEKSLKADFASSTVTRSSAQAQQKSLATAIATLEKGDAKALAGATSKVNADVNRLQAAVAIATKNPNSTADTAKVAGDTTALTTDSTTDLTAINTANNGLAVSTALSTIVSDGGTISTAASNSLATLGTDAQAFASAATLAFSTDVTAIVTAS